MIDSIEYVRQQAIAFKEAEKIWKKKAPKGKRYAGFRFKPFADTDDNGWKSMGWEAVPVYEKLTPVQDGKEGK